MLDTKKLAEYAATLPNVVVADDDLSLCTDSGAEHITRLMTETRANRLVVSACTPKTHLPVFRAVLESMGLDPSYLEFVNLREHVSFVHMRERGPAQKMAEDLLRGAVARAALLEVVPTKVVPVKKAVAVIGAGVAGIQTAIDLANNGFEVHLIEEKPSIGGKMAMLDRTYPTDDCSI